MAGGERRGAKLLSGLQQVAELDLLIAGDARYRSLAGEIAVGKRAHHVSREPRLIVEAVMGDAESLRHAAGILNVLSGAAGALAANRLAMIVELEGDADHVIALTLQESCDHGGIDPSGHGDHHPGVGRTPRQMKAVEPVG